MTRDTLITTENRSVETTEGVTLAYRRFGDASRGAPPLVFLQRFRGNLGGFPHPSTGAAPRTSRTASSIPAVHGSPCPGSTISAGTSSISAKDSSACTGSAVNGAILGPRAPVVTA